LNQLRQKFDIFAAQSLTESNSETGRYGRAAAAVTGDWQVDVCMTALLTGTGHDFVE